MNAGLKLLKFATLIALIWLAGACVHSNQNLNPATERSDASISSFSQEMERGGRHSLNTFGLPDN